MSKKKWIFSAGAAVALVVAGAGPAAAHVTAQPGEATQGGYAGIAFRVPNERPQAGTVRIEVTLPAEHPIATVITKPMAGWTIQVVKDKDTVQQISWTAQPGVRINPGEYEDFEIAAGPLPEDTDTLLMPTRQTYDNGEVVAWDAPPAPDGAEEPEYPAPMLTLHKAADTDGESDGTGSGSGTGAEPTVRATSVSSADSTARWLGGVGVIVGALGLGLAAGAVLRIRHRDSA